MHIGHFVRDLNGRGGIETYVTRLGRALVERGHEVTYFGLEGTPETSSHIRVPDVEKLYERAQSSRVDLLHLHKAVHEPPPTSLPVVRTVHDNGAACPSGSRYLARTGQPCPRIASLPACLFGHFVDGCGSRRPAKVWTNFQRLADNKRILPEVQTIAVSNYLKEEMVTLGYPADRIQVIASPAPQGPAAAPALDTDSPPRFLFLGRLVPEKGLDWLLRALSRVDGPVQLDVAGEGYHRAALEAEVDRLGLQESVSFHGWVEGQPLDALFRSARAVVVPSVWHEPAGLVPLEAAAWARPVIAAAVGGLPEYAASSYSVLVSPNDEEELADAIQRLSDHPHEAATLGRAGHAYVRAHHTMATTVTEHEEVYRSAIGESVPEANGVAEPPRNEVI